MKVRSGLLGLPLAVLLIDISGVLADSEKPFGLEKRVKWTTSRLVGWPDPPQYRLTRAFTKFAFKEPVFIAQDPKSDRFMVAEYTPGKIYSFRPDDPSGKKDLFLDMKRGISAFSFHPKYAENGYVFVFSHWTRRSRARSLAACRAFSWSREQSAAPSSGIGDDHRRVARGRAQRRRGHHRSRRIPLHHHRRWHQRLRSQRNRSGHERSARGHDAPRRRSPRPRPELLDPEGQPVRRHDGRAAGDLGVRVPQSLADELRSPDRPALGRRRRPGSLGDDRWSIAGAITAGASWRAPIRSTPTASAGPRPSSPPVVEHHHTECRSITGGYVYQGDKFPELRGAYIYGDYQYGKMWGLRYDTRRRRSPGTRSWPTPRSTSPASASAETATSTPSITIAAKFISSNGSRPPAPLPPFPRKLSETGLFTSVAKHQVAPGVIPYEINAPYWSDGAHKERFFALPGEAKIAFHGSKPWEFDDGAVTVKTFSLDMEEGNPRRGSGSRRASWSSRTTTGWATPTLE